MSRRGWAMLLAGIVQLFVSAAALELSTPDGRRVRLNDDFTWEYVETGADPSQARVELHVVNAGDVPGGCKFGLRLVNKLDVEVKSIVPRFSAITTNGVEFETVFQSFGNIKPTADLYREIRFTGIDCSEIPRVRVSGGDRCAIGELHKFSPPTGECLALVRVVPSDLVEIFK